MDLKRRKRSLTLIGTIISYLNVNLYKIYYKKNKNVTEIVVEFHIFKENL